MEKQVKSKAGKIAGIIVNTLLWLFVIFSVVVTVMAVSATANQKGIPSIGGSCYLAVQSGSMNAPKPDGVGADKPEGFCKGDMLIARNIAGNAEAIAALQVGDIITFEWDITGDGVIGAGEYNTHRIIEIVTKDGKIEYFKTQGDNPEYSRGQTENVYPSRILAQYTGRRIAGLGSALDFLRSSLGFGLCVLLPLALFFMYQLFVFVRALMQIRNEGKRMITAQDEEQIKARAIEEYLRRQQQGEEHPHDSDSEK